MLYFEDEREWVGKDADFREEHMQLKHGDGKLRCAHGLELFFEGEGSISVIGLEAETVAGYFLTLFDEIWLEGLNISGRGEVKRLFGLQVSQ